MNSLMSMRTMASSVSKSSSARALHSSVLPTPVGPRNRKLPMGRCGSPRPGAVAPHGVGDRADRVVLPDHALAQPLFHVQQLFPFALQQLRDGDVRPLGDDLGDVARRDLLAAPARRSLLSARQAASRLGDAASAVRRSSPYWIRAAFSRSPARWACSSSVCLAWISCSRLLHGFRRSFARSPTRPSAPILLLQLGQLLLDRLQPLAAGRVLFLPQASRSICICMMRRRSSSISAGIESFSIRSRLAASSTRSMALSGRKRSVM